MAHEERIRREDDPARDLDCERCEPLLSSYLLEELPPPEREQVGSHLGECGKCRDGMDLLKATAEALAKSPPPGDVPAGVEREPLLRKARSHQRAPTPLWWAAAAAAALVVAGTSIAIYQAGRPDRESGDLDVLARRDSEGIPANDLRSRSRFGLEQVGIEGPAQSVPPKTVPAQVVPAQAVQAQGVPAQKLPALHPAPAPEKPGEAAAGGRKAGPQTGVEEKDVVDAFAGWPLLAKTNEDGTAPTPETRALKLAPARPGASPRSPFGTTGGADAARDLVFERAPTVQGAADPAQGASLATGPTPGKLPAVRRERE